MGTHGSGRRHTPEPVKVARRPTPKPPPTIIPPEPTPTPDEHVADLARLHLSAAALLNVLHRMPWCRDHRPDCPASSAGPCTCGSGDLVAAMAHVRVALDA